MTLKVNKLQVHYDNKEALRQIDLEVESRSVVCLLGPNGAGKSTFMRTLTGLKSASSGEIIFDGKNITRLSSEKIVRAGIALVPEGRRVFPHMPVLDNLMMGAFTRSDGRAVKDDLERMYGLFPVLKSRSGQKAGTLSGGEQQMLAIARGLMAGPKLLALDEPSLGLAPLVIEEIGRLIQKLQQEGLTILLVEQNSRLALGVASKVYVLENGRVVMGGLPGEIEKDEHLRRAYLGKA